VAESGHTRLPAEQLYAGSNPALGSGSFPFRDETYAQQ
jgi:hypothetical protein